MNEPAKTNLFSAAPAAGLQLAVFDLETTGLSADADDMIEIAVASLNAGQPVDVFQSLITTDKQLTSVQSMRAGGISNQELSSAPHLPNVMNQVYRQFSGKVWVAHNAHRFDAKFMMSAAPNLFGEFDFLDTLPLAQKVLPGLKRLANYKLDTLCTLFGGSTFQSHQDQTMVRHRAKGDVMSLIPVVNSLLMLLPNPTDVMPFIKKGKQLWGGSR